jgi:hypothetical protein
MLTLIAFIYGIIVSYMQLYDGFCIKELNLNSRQNLQIDLLINDTKYAINEACSNTFINSSGKTKGKVFQNNLLLISLKKKSDGNLCSNLTYTFAIFSLYRLSINICKTLKKYSGR